MEHTKIEIDKIEFPLESQFHVLKHFVKIESLYRKLIQEKYSEEDINKQLELAGSKFHYEFANNPFTLLEILSNSKIREFENALIIDVNEKEYPNGIGYDNLIHINKLSEGFKKKLVRNSKTNILYLPDSEIREPSFQINYILVNEINSYKVRTIFPGKFAPPFPDCSFMDKKAFKSSSEFWDEHCILE